MREFVQEMEHVITLLNHYPIEVKYILDNKISSSSVSHLTFSLASHLVKTLQKAKEYKFLVTYYLLDDNYEKNSELLEKYKNATKEVIRVLQNLAELDIFTFGDNDDNDVTQNLIFKSGFKKYPFGLINLKQEIELSQMNGIELLQVFHAAISAISKLLIEIKDNSTYFTLEEFEKIFDINYALFEKNNWVSLYSGFRSKHNFPYVEVITVDALKNVLHDEIWQFEVTKEGRIWRNYGNNKGEMARQLKNLNMDNSQWEFFFNNLFRFEEYKKWIDELRNPPESDEDKELRDKLLRSNTILDIQKMQDKGIDILKLYKYIKIHFINDDMKAYLWYALRRFLEKLDILLDCTNVDFEKQMNKSEWFNNVPKPCSDNEMNNFNFLNGKHSSLWLSADIPGGSRASKSGLRNVFNAYSDLELNVKELVE